MGALLRTCPPGRDRGRADRGPDAAHGRVPAARGAGTRRGLGGHPWAAACSGGSARPVAAARRVAAAGRVAAPGQAAVAGPAGPRLDRALRRWAARLGEVPPEPRWPPGGGTASGWSSPVTPNGQASSTCWATPVPGALWVRGDADLRYACLRSVSVVGTRAATAYGCHVCTEMAVSLADAGWTVVSGGAYGIDGCAHRGALAAAGTTIAVLPCGVDCAYPPGHERALPVDPRAGRDRQRVAAGPDADQARLPGPQPGDRGAEPRHRGGGGGAAQRGAQHRAARP